MFVGKPPLSLTVVECSSRGKSLVVQSLGWHLVANEVRGLRNMNNLGAKMSWKTWSTIVCCVLVSLVTAAASAYDLDRTHNRVLLASLDDFGRCQDELSNSDACLDALKRFVEANPKAGFAAGKLVRARFNHWLALQFFVPTLTKATAVAYCDDEDLRLAVLSGLALPADDPNEALALKAATGVCAAKLQPHIRKGFGDGNAFYLKNACAVFAPPQAPLVCGVQGAR
jgi:hypothetical protein